MQKSFLRTTAETIMRAGVVVVTIVIIFIAVSALYEAESGVSDGSCNIAVYPIEGAIIPYYGLGDFEMITTPDAVEAFLSAVEDEVGIDGVLIEFNSPGGTPVASERIAERLKDSPLPVVGLVGDMAASGAYLIASGVDYLIASPMSDVGSIGVNMSYVEESEKNEEEGLTYVQLTSAKFKDIGSPDRPITDEERGLLLADLQIIHDEFVRQVADNRDLPLEEVQALADGASMPGQRALDNGLIDSLGGRQTARESFAKILEIPIEEVVFCEYQAPLLPLI
jgi:protease-4